MKQQFDVVVIGTGSAGSAAAFACREAGKTVAITDEREYGGTCALRGCDPKKVLVGAAEIIERAGRMEGRGIAGDTRIDWGRLMAFKQTFTDPVPHEREQAYREKNITTFHGRASFTSSQSISIGEDTIDFQHAVIATGAIPAPLQIDGAEHVRTSEEFLNLEILPKRIVFIGGGYVSFEFAHIARRAGADVTILQHGPRALPGFDSSLVDRLVEIGAAIGIAVRVNADVVAVKQDGAAYTVVSKEPAGEISSTADLVIHGAGRIPNVAGLKLDRGGVSASDKGVTVNEYLQSVSNPSVYAAGDCVRAGGLPLTPVAGLEGEIAAKNIVRTNSAKPDFAGLVSIVYTLPALGSVGLTEEQAKQRGTSFSTHGGDATTFYSSRRMNASGAAYRIFVDHGDNVIGAHVLGPYAEELLNIFSLAMCAKIPATTIRQALYAWPSGASDLEYMLA